jgi:hypothetical protein
MKHQDDEPLGNAFDVTWLTVVCVKLKEVKAGNRPMIRVKGKPRKKIGARYGQRTEETARPIP